MTIKGRSKQMTGYSLMLALAVLLFCTSYFVGQAEPFPEIREKLTGITAQEREIIKNLFILVQEAQGLERQEAALASEMAALEDDIKDLEGRMKAQRAVFENKQAALKQVLRSYQRRGPASYLEVILDSDSLNTFLRRINTLRDLTRNTGRLLDSLEESRNRLAAEEASMKEKLALMEAKQVQLKAALEERLQLKADREALLAALGKERSHFQDFLSEIEQVWEAVQSLFPELVKVFSGMIESGGFPPDALEIKFSFFSVRASIDDDTFNEIVAAQSGLPKMTFSFIQDKVELEMPEQNLTLTGTFVVQDSSVLKLQVLSGSFFGMPLKPEALEELFRGGNLSLDFKPVLGRNILQGVELKEDSLEFVIKPVFFQ